MFIQWKRVTPGYVNVYPMETRNPRLRKYLSNENTLS